MQQLTEYIAVAVKYGKLAFLWKNEEAKKLSTVYRFFCLLNRGGE